MLAVNVQGVWNTVRAGAPYVVPRGDHIVVISSVMAFFPSPLSAAYGASKAAVEAVARAYRIELAGTGATVGVAHFGLIDTPLLAVADEDPLAAEFDALVSTMLRRRASATGGGRGGRPRHRATRAAHHPPRAYRVGYHARGVTGPLGDAVIARSSRFAALVERVRQRHRSAPR